MSRKPPPDKPRVKNAMLAKFDGEYEEGKEPVEENRTVGSDDLGVATTLEISLVRTIAKAVAANRQPPDSLRAELLTLWHDAQVLATHVAEETRAGPKPKLNDVVSLLDGAFEALREGQPESARQACHMANALLEEYVLRERRASRETGREDSRKRQRAEDERIAAIYVELRPKYRTSAEAQRWTVKRLPSSSSKGNERLRRRVRDALRRLDLIIKINGRWVDAPR